METNEGASEWELVSISKLGMGEESYELTIGKLSLIEKSCPPGRGQRDQGDVKRPPRPLWTPLTPS